MKERLMSVMREFYHDGIPKGVVPRDVEYAEKLRASTVIKGMRRTGKTFVTYERMNRLVSEGVPLGRIVHVNFDDERLSHPPGGLSIPRKYSFALRVRPQSFFRRRLRRRCEVGPCP